VTIDQSGEVRVANGRTGGGPRHLQLTLPASGQPVRLARQVAREVLTAWRLTSVEETAILLVSELVTNAVRDAASSDVITLELEVVHAYLRIESYRCRPGLAMPRTTGEFDESGFEFALVHALADTWGVRESVTGKTAWAKINVGSEPGLR